MFALWDWAFGSLYVTRGKENLVFGIGERENRDFSSLWRLYAFSVLQLVEESARALPANRGASGLDVALTFPASERGRGHLCASQRSQSIAALHPSPAAVIA
jgi:hypothetical protein